MTSSAAAALDPTAAFFAALSAVEAALTAADWTAAGEAAVELEAAARACSTAGVTLGSEAVARARAIADRCSKRVVAAHAHATGELAALGSAGRARDRYSP